MLKQMAGIKQERTTLVVLFGDKKKPMKNNMLKQEIRTTNILTGNAVLCFHKTPQMPGPRRMSQFP
jgi:hypothetical protein